MLGGPHVSFSAAPGSSGGGASALNPWGQYKSGFFYGVYAPGNVTTTSNTPGVLLLIPFVAFTTFHATAIYCYATLNRTFTAGLVRSGIYTDAVGKPTDLILDAGTRTAATRTGHHPQTSPITHTLTPGYYWLCIVNQSTGKAMYVRRPDNTSTLLVGEMGRSTPNNSSTGIMGYSTTGVTGALPATLGALTEITVAGHCPCIFLKHA